MGFLKSELEELCSHLLEDVKIHLDLEEKFLNEAKKIFKEYKENTEKFSVKSGKKEGVKSYFVEHPSDGGNKLKEINNFSEEEFSRWLLGELESASYTDNISFDLFELEVEHKLYFSFDASENSIFGKFLRSMNKIHSSTQIAKAKLNELGKKPDINKIEGTKVSLRKVEDMPSEEEFSYKFNSAERELKGLKEELSFGKDKEDLGQDSLNNNVVT